MGWLVGGGGHGAFTETAPPTVDGPIGAFVNQNTGETPDQAITRYNTSLGTANPSTPGATGNIQKARVYDFGQHGHAAGTDALTYAAGLSGLGVIPLMCSLSAVASPLITAGTFASIQTVVMAMLAAFSATPLSSSCKVAICARHEPDVQGYTAAQWSAAENLLDSWITSHGDPNIEHHVIFGGGSSGAQMTSRLNTYWPGVAGTNIKAVGNDAYPLVTTATGTNRIIPMLDAVAAVTGISRQFVGETGLASSMTVPEAVTWVQSLGVLKSLLTDGLLWWNDSATNDITQAGYATVAAAMEALVLA